EELAYAHGNSAQAKAANEVPLETRASMDDQVAATMTYPEWLAAQPPEVQDEALGPVRAELFRTGALSIGDLTLPRGGNFLTINQLQEAFPEAFATAAEPTAHELVDLKPSTEPTDTGTAPMAEPEPSKPSAPEPPEPAVEGMERTSTKDAMMTLPVSGKEGLGGGVNQTFTYNIEGGMKGVFKPEVGETSQRSSIDNKLGASLWQREVAASDVADILEQYDLVPVTVERTINGEVGSLQ